MSNRKTWGWTDDPSILRNRVTFLNQDLDTAEARISDLERVLIEERKDTQYYRRLFITVSRKLDTLQDWLNFQRPPSTKE